MKKMILISSLILMVSVAAFSPIASAQQPFDYVVEEFFYSEIGALGFGTVGYLASLFNKIPNAGYANDYYSDLAWHFGRSVGAGLGATKKGVNHNVKGNTPLAIALPAAYLIIPSTVNKFHCAPLDVRYEETKIDENHYQVEEIVTENNSLLCQAARSMENFVTYTPFVPAILATIGYNIGAEL